MRLVDPYRLGLPTPAPETDSYVTLGGTGSGQFISTPNASKLQITGDLSLIARVRLADWTPSAVAAVVGKYGGGATNRDYQLQITTAGRQQFTFGNGTATLSPSASSNPTGGTMFADGTNGWIASTVDVDDGAGNYVIRWWLAADQTAIPTSWTLVPGGTSTTAGPMNRVASTIALAVGATAAGGSLLNGRIYRVLVANDIGAGGVPGTSYQASLNPADWSAGTTWVSPLTGETWTLQGGATVTLAP